MASESIIINGAKQVIIRDNVIVKMVHIEESSDSEADLLILGNHKRKK
jgi:hypothetical protein